MLLTSGVDIIKLFTFVTDNPLKYYLVYVPEKLWHRLKNTEFYYKKFTRDKHSSVLCCNFGYKGNRFIMLTLDLKKTRENFGLGALSRSKL